MKPKQGNLARQLTISGEKIICVGDLVAPKGLGAVKEFLRLKSWRLPDRYPEELVCRAHYTLSGRLMPNNKYKDRYAITEALLPIVRSELEAAGS